MLSDMIDVAKGFQTSVNINYDLYNDEKIKAFIPTSSSIDIIGDVMLSTAATSTQRANILIGAYGRGKSHIILVLLSLLLKNDKSIFKTLLDKIEIYNPTLYEYINRYFKDGRPFFPVVIGGSSTSLTQSFLNALQMALSTAGQTDIMPDTHFQAAINAIQIWKDKYPATYSRFGKMISGSIMDFVLALKQYNVTKFEQFTNLYPVLTSGGTFNPFVGFDVVELYQKVVDKLTQHGYAGMFIVYDEFSKYLESSIANATISDIKLLQDFAEKCNRSGKKQMHLMLICHKDISNYIDTKLPKEKVDGWRGVSGRFRHINLHNNYGQMYEIIGSVIKKSPSPWKTFQSDHQADFSDLRSHFLKSGLLNESEVDLCVNDCYPLHPYSTFILPRISEKVAQNERTLFTFLSSTDHYSLSAFLTTAKERFPLLTPDYLYDYFEPLFRMESYTSELHKLYKLTTSILNKVNGNPLAAKIIKTIALIYAVEQFEKLAPTYSTINDAFKYTVDDIKLINNTIKDLIEKNYIVYHKLSNGYLKLKESSGVDILGQINEQVENVKIHSSYQKILNSENNDSYMFPNRYNEEMEITRYFDFVFLESNELFDKSALKQYFEQTQADGIVFAILLQSNDEIINIKKQIDKISSEFDRAVFALPKKYSSVEEIAFKYQAAIELKGLADVDASLVDEYNIFIEDFETVINRFIVGYTHPELGESEYYYNGKISLLSRRAQLSALLSEVCKKKFSLTPKINNESINKNELPSVAINSRYKILTGLLANELNANLGLTGTGQDVSIMRSTLIRPGVLANSDTVPSINMHPADEKLANVLFKIDVFLTSAMPSDEQCFAKLYEELTKPENKIGMRLGIIPIYLAAVLHLHRNQIVIKHGGIEVKLSADTLNAINEAPGEYTVYFEVLNKEKVQYLRKLESIFKDFVIDGEKLNNNDSYITNAMYRWFMSLPKYAKEMTSVFMGKDSEVEFVPLPKNEIQFIKSIRQPITNVRDYLYKGIFKNFGMEGFNSAVISNIELVKGKFDNAIDNLIHCLIGDTKKFFQVSKASENGLCKIVNQWSDGLSEAAKDNIFPNQENQIVELFQIPGNNDVSLMRRLCKIVTSLRIEDWENATIGYFQRELAAFKNTVEEFNSIPMDQREASSSYRLAYKEDDGKEIIKTFSKVEYSQRAQLLYNEIETAIDEMGQSISEQEKRQVLLEILSKLC